MYLQLIEIRTFVYCNPSTQPGPAEVLESKRLWC